jgi:hypothetical protein
MRQKQTNPNSLLCLILYSLYWILIFSKRAPKIVNAPGPTTPGSAPNVRIKKYVVKVWKGEATGYSEHGNVLGGFTEAGDFFTSSATTKFSISIFVNNHLDARDNPPVPSSRVRQTATVTAVWLQLDLWRWDRLVVPKRQYGITILQCVQFETKSAHIYFTFCWPCISV